MNIQWKGVNDDSCYLPVKTGYCRMAIRSWYFEYKRYQTVGECKQFICVGCGGNGNRYSSKLECEKMCLH